ncbi:response regulator [Deinococcus peraridilitoris]|uniref:Response regulator containing a CheY-like receiver domain and an HTH DNA-binding domain protein n=1 Tax=Deinococcus peraridilitoris (strain DSM 19664 / LMG 22246 / CIP 109416 / KR-200) TaxID=937777 RepID=L0A0A6_DEIPD|nr:response regulator [Deinococcus peraridilitoris]AFZ66889.1 response regulator containing a CheY-like receiver domain and an HTH DNA-binding domain protein [Deinococcus peraridilitoris DSM 19664]
MTTPLVLLVDDNEADLMLALAAIELSSLKADVCIARDGEEALEFLRRSGRHANRPDNDPSVVLLDLNMPRMNGLEVLSIIRADASLRRIPVVMLTTSAEQQDIDASYERGSNAYVVKPVSFDGTVEAMRTLAAFWTMLNNTVTPKNGAGRSS